MNLQRLSDLAARARTWDMNADWEELDSVIFECPERDKEDALRAAEYAALAIEQDSTLDPFTTIFARCDRQGQPGLLPFAAANYWADRIARETWAERERTR